MAAELHTTVLHDRHVELGAQMVEFGGWDMPICIRPALCRNIRVTRKNAGIFDVSHMGRFIFCGKNAVAFLQYTLTNNAAALNPARVNIP